MMELDFHTFPDVDMWGFQLAGEGHGSNCVDDVYSLEF